MNYFQIKSSAVLLAAAVVMSLSFCGGRDKPVKKSPPVPVTEQIQGQVKLLGGPRVEQISDHVWAAIGYDLANLVLVNTGDGIVIVDPLMSPTRAKLAKEALAQAGAPSGKVLAIIYTHSHIDHIGGASVFVEDGTQIWATDAFIPHLLKQYEKFLPIETIRARRQFGDHESLEDLPIHGLGPRMDIDAAKQSGVRLPTHTFSGTTTLTFGGVTLELNEAPGETHDALFVWVPQDKTVIAGDNFYFAFPNLYTIRGASPRPIDEWIASLDHMRRKQALHLIPGHTNAVHGADAIQEALTNYRDAIQWVRDETIRLANLGLDMDDIALSVKLPDHLQGLSYLQEFYGQVDWSARAVYSNHLGWFDGGPDKLYPLPKKDLAAREVKMMGGPDAVMSAAKAAIASDPSWALHLLTKLGHSGLYTGPDRLDDTTARACEALAAKTSNLNGRAYLLEWAYELRNGIEKPAPAKLDPEMALSIPLDTIFSIMVSRLKPDKAMDVHESVRFEFPSENKIFIMTIRHGIAELAVGEPLPGTPEPIAVVIADGPAYRRIAVLKESPLGAITGGELKVEGSLTGFLGFMRNFDQEG